MPDAPKKSSTAAKSLAYAENELGVHEVFEEAEKARAKLDATYSELSEKRDYRRELEAKLDDLMMIVAEDERGKHPDMSQAQMDKHVKIAYSKSVPIVDTRNMLRQLTNDIEGLEYDESYLKHKTSILTARMTQLGGYLNFLAVIKYGDLLRKERNARSVDKTKLGPGPWDNAG